MTIPEQAVQAAKDVLYYANPNDVERALTAAFPFLSVRGAVNIDEIVQPLEDIHAPGGLCRWADVATAIGEVRRALSALQPSPRDELMKQIREGTAYGFLNDGSQPEGNPDLDCPYCCGSGHKGDIEPSAGRAAVLEEARGSIERIIHHHFKGPNLIDADWDRPTILGLDNSWRRQVILAADEVIDHLSTALSSHPVADKPDEAGAQGEVPTSLHHIHGVSLEVATALVEMFGGEETDMTVEFIVNGHSGTGFYCWCTEYPEDGSSYLGPASEHSYLSALPTHPSSEVA